VAILSVLTMFGVISPAVLLVLTFLLNIGSAMNNPAWQAIVPELVPRAELPDCHRAQQCGVQPGPAVDPRWGARVAAFTSPRVGAAVVFLLNSISFLAVISCSTGGSGPPLFNSALPVSASLAMRSVCVTCATLRPARHMLRAFLFTGFASAVWALLAVWRSRTSTPAPWPTAYSTVASVWAPSPAPPAAASAAQTAGGVDARGTGLILLHLLTLALTHSVP